LSLAFTAETKNSDVQANMARVIVFRVFIMLPPTRLQEV
jgi:hypothetical protein